ncbi:MAG: 5-(carboxyamino)imidazole ribonucleotide synthase [Spartobacteria bacterium]|nr:5-(carboxyamino)imidazole ribonucleotide synthase [Spartobacteria bacterium]
MFAKAAARLGYHVHVFAPESESPAAEVSAWHTRAPYEDLDAVKTFAQSVDAITYEFENVLDPTVETAAQYAPVCPHIRVLSVTRNRLTEKRFLHNLGLPVTPFRAAYSAEDLAEALTAFCSPAVLKTTAFGYDGKGQVRVKGPLEASAAWASIGHPSEAIVEKFVPFDGECSMLVARGYSGKLVYYGPFYNEHENHILDLSTWRYDERTPVARQARAICEGIADAMDLDGMICIEFFIVGEQLLVNEIAPRPHNSAHLTLEACSISQFEQQVRLAAGYEPQEPAARAPAAAMVNILGDLWANGPPDWASALADPEVCFHLYGKSIPRPGRKMGHFTVLAHTPEEAAERSLHARRLLNCNPSVTTKSMPV